MVTAYDLGRGHQRDGVKSSGNNIRASHGAGLTGVGPSGLCQTTTKGRTAAMIGWLEAILNTLRSLTHGTESFKYSERFLASGITEAPNL